MTPGWKTSEFWLTLAVQVVAMAVLFGFVPASDKDAVTSGISDIVKNAFALIASASVAWKYIHGRIDLKKTHVENES